MHQLFSAMRMLLHECTHFLTKMPQMRSPSRHENPKSEGKVCGASRIDSTTNFYVKGGFSVSFGKLFPHSVALLKLNRKVSFA